MFVVITSRKGRAIGHNYFDTIDEAQDYARELADGGSPCEVAIIKKGDKGYRNGIAELRKGGE